LRWWRRTKGLGGWSVDRTHLLFHLLVITNYIIIHYVFVPNLKLTPLCMVACLHLSMESISYLTYRYYKLSNNKFGLCNLVNYFLNYFRCCSLGIYCLLSSLFLAFLNLNFYISFAATLSIATPLWPSVGVKPNTSKVGDLESSGTPECLEFDSKAQNTSYWCVLGVIGKVLKRRYRK
jgi:hypothetical protein